MARDEIQDTDPREAGLGPRTGIPGAGAAATESGATAAEREGLARRLDKPMGVLGVVFLLVVLAQTLARDDRLVTALAVVGWVMWAVFVAEFVLRAVTARDRRRFWARHWWQVVFLAVPFLRFARALVLLRAARVGGVLSAAVRGSRSAGRLLSGRIGWLLAITGVVVLAASQVLYLAGAYDDYASALHDAALATVTGEPLSSATGVARLLEVVLAVYSVAVFATLAGALGAYFLERPQPTGPASDRHWPPGRV
jgi:voltage-gated potassium channel